jgi:predicted N-formylglutamate amidohydrolase
MPLATERDGLFQGVQVHAIRTKMLRQPASEPAPTVAAVSGEAHVRLAGALAPGIILLCDHAENALPEGYGSLGLNPDEFRRHIAYDIGARSVTERLAGRLGVPAVLTRYSRLLIDCNRGEDDPTLIMRLSDGTIIPGNRVLDPAERDRRIERYYLPYHAAITDLLDRAREAGVVPLLLSVHSFTPAWKGVPRPWHAAVLWDKDPRLAVPLMAALARETGVVVGDNEPYTGRLKGDTMWRHGTERGLPHAIVEIRQDLIETEVGQELWAARLETAVRGILASAPAGSDLRVERHFGSHTF